MDQQRFDALLRKLAEEPRPRRTALRLVAATALTGLLARAGVGEQAADAAGCRKVDTPCRRARQCCSGICRGKKGKKTCRGHGAGTCRRGQGVCTAPDPALLKCNNDADCVCLLTTAGTSFCAVDGFVCAVCQRDADCVKRGFPRGSACARVSAGRCAGACESGTACLVPCGLDPPAP